MVRTIFPNAKLQKKNTNYDLIEKICSEMAYPPTSKQKLMALYLFEGASDAEAYRRAGYAIPSTANGLYVNAHKYAHCAKVQLMVNALERTAVERSIANRTECEQVLTEIIRGRVTDFLDDKGNRIVATPKDLNTAAIQGVKTAYVMVGKGEDGKLVEITELKFHDPIKAIETLAKLNKWTADAPAGGPSIGRVNIININLNQMSDNELEKIISGELVIDCSNIDEN